MKLSQRLSIVAFIIQFVEYLNEIVVLLNAVEASQDRDKCLESSTIIFHHSPQNSRTHLFLPAQALRRRPNMRNFNFHAPGCHSRACCSVFRSSLNRNRTES